MTRSVFQTVARSSSQRGVIHSPPSQGNAVMTSEPVKGQNASGNAKQKLIRIGLSWNFRVKPVRDFDLDASAFMLGQDGKVLDDSGFVFYNQPESSDGSVAHLSDDEEGENETIVVDLYKIPEAIVRVAITATIYKGAERRQNFGALSSARVRLVDVASEKELARYELTKDAGNESAVVVGEFVRSDGKWRFYAAGEGRSGGLYAIAKDFGVNV
jgi:tellurium resistance protein TerD